MKRCPQKNLETRTPCLKEPGKQQQSNTIYCHVRADFAQPNVEPRLKYLKKRVDPPAPASHASLSVSLKLLACRCCLPFFDCAVFAKTRPQAVTAGSASLTSAYHPCLRGCWKVSRATDDAPSRDRAFASAWRDVEGWLTRLAGRTRPDLLHGFPPVSGGADHQTPGERLAHEATRLC